MSDDDKTTKKNTLTDDDVITDERSYGRRSTFGMLGVGTVSAVALATGCGGYVRRRRIIRAQVQSGVTDSDAGAGCADPAGGGRGPTGITDSDNSGYCRNAAGYGRGGGVVVQQQTTGITDSDGGPCADPGGNGRGYSGITDSDNGTCADPGGRGRGY